MAWLAVDKNGLECIYNDKPIRKNNIWSIDYPRFERDFIDTDLVTLPKGSIEKLIGRQLTWEEEPVEIK